MRKLLLFPALLMLLVCASSPAFAKNWPQLSGSDIHEIDYLTPGAEKTHLGQRLYGNSITGTLTTANVSSAIGATASAGSYRIVLWQVPTGGYGQSLPNGYAGETLTVVVSTNTGAKAGKITPVTKTGFTDIKLTNVGDGITLRYVDDTVGWIPEGNFGNATNGVVEP